MDTQTQTQTVNAHGSSLVNDTSAGETITNIMLDKKVLIIEDDAFLRTLALGRIKQDIMYVEVAETGTQGLAKIKSFAPDLVILDIMLPEMNGFEILETLKSENILNPKQFIMFSNLGSPEDISRAMELGVTHYLIKSNFTLDEVTQQVIGMLNGNII
jgi:DNA-binding response OmpR family regulator